MAFAKPSVGTINRSHPLAHHLKSAWLFDHGSGSGLAVDALGINTGTVSATQPTQVSTPWGYGASFGGTSTITRAYPNTMNSPSFTAALRFRLDADLSAAEHDFISLNGASNGYPFRIGVNLTGFSDGRLVFAAYDGSSLNLTFQSANFVGVAGNVGKWYDLIVSSGANSTFSMIVYNADGGLVDALGPSPDGLTESGETLDSAFVMGGSAGGSNFSNITVAHFFFWNAPLQFEQAAQIHANPYAMFLPYRPMMFTSTAAPVASNRLLTLGVG